MDLHELAFAKINILREDIAEVIINDGIEMDAAMVEEYHQFLQTHLRAPFSLLINKINRYTYNFDAQVNLANIDEINTMAVVSYNRSTEVTTQYLATVPRTKAWNMRIFYNHDEALSWLVAEQDNVKAGD